MPYIQATTEAEFKAAKPKKNRLYPVQERALFEWAMNNSTWVSLADNVGVAKLNTIKIALDKGHPGLTKAAKIASDMKIIPGQGSSATRGKSTADTKITENLQCIYLAAKYENVNREKVKSFSGDLTINQCLTKIKTTSGPGVWYASSIAIADAIYTKYKGTGWKFRRGDSWVKDIYNKFNKLNRDEEGDKIFSQGDKWNPADIWMTKGAPKIPDSVTTLLELNVWLEGQYNNRHIIPISLKQHIGTGPVKLELKKYYGYKADDYNFDGYTISVQDYDQSKYTVIYFNNDKREEIFLRTVPAFVGEIQGPGYRIGKITYSNAKSPLGRRIEKHLAKTGVVGGDVIDLTVPNFEMAAEKFRAENQKIHDEIMQDFYDTYENIVANQGDDNVMHNKFLHDDRDEFYKKTDNAASTDGTYKVSKYIGMKIIQAVIYSDKQQRNTFISSVVQYAKSESELSSIHLVAT